MVLNQTLALELYLAYLKKLCRFGVCYLSWAWFKSAFTMKFGVIFGVTPEFTPDFQCNTIQYRNLYRAQCLPVGRIGVISDLTPET